MQELIRQIRADDIPKISHLYNGRKSVEELEWLFEDPDNKAHYNGYVSERKNGETVGAIGFTVSEYRQNNHSARGIIPFSWRVKDGYKGFAGVQLMKKIFEKGDFGIAISGSKKAYKLYRLFHLNQHSRVNTYFCLLDPLQFFLSLEKSGIKSAALTTLLLPSYLAQLRQTHEQDIHLEPYDGKNFIPDTSSSPFFRKIVTKNQLDWMLRCPCVDCYVFNVFRKQKPLGFCVFYITKGNRGRRGRIVHFPALCHEPVLWISVMQQSISFFKSKDCCSFTVLAHADYTGMLFQQVGLLCIKRHTKPVFVRDTGNALNNIDLSKWTIQYDEGDKAYREI